MSGGAVKIISIAEVLAALSACAPQPAPGIYTGFTPQPAPGIYTGLTPQQKPDYKPTAYAEDYPARYEKEQPNNKLRVYIDSLIQQDSAGWFINKYDPGSTNYVEIVSGTTDSGNYKAKANYTYNGGQRGWVIINVQKNDLRCLTYFDQPSVCRRPTAANAESRPYLDIAQEEVLKVTSDRPSRAAILVLYDQFDILHNTIVEVESMAEYEGVWNVHLITRRRGYEYSQRETLRVYNNGGYWERLLF